MKLYFYLTEITLVMENVIKEIFLSYYSLHPTRLIPYTPYTLYPYCTEIFWKK